MMKVIFTIDTEHCRGGIPYMISGDLSGLGIKNNYGIQAIMDCFDRFSMHAVFFVNVYENGTFDSPYEYCIEESIKSINNRGHEIGLHWHTNAINKKEWRASNRISSLDEAEQIKMINKGIDFIYKTIDKKPISFRAGSYRINDHTINALAKCGILYDSSYWYGQPHNIVKEYKTINKNYRIKGVYEFPVITVFNSSGVEKKLDFDLLTNSEIVDCLYYLNRKGYKAIQIMFHSFSFLKPATSQDEILFTCGNRNYSGGNDAKLKKLEELLAFLSLSPDFDVITFSELNPESLLTDEAVDGFIPVNSEKSKNSALIYNQYNRYSYEYGRVVNFWKENSNLFFKNGELVFEINQEIEGLPYQYYVLKGDEVVLKSTLNDKGSIRCKIDSPGDYRVKMFAKINGGEISSFSNTVIINDNMEELV